MTPEQHDQLIRDLERMLHIADYGMALPRDAQRVLELRKQINQTNAAYVASNMFKVKS